jgi:hypothetical protein
MRSKTMTRAKTSGERAAELTGAALRTVGRGFFGVMGPLVIAVGFWMAWPPLGVIALGLTLLAADRRVP